MVIILFLFFNIFSLYSQGIPTGFFCDDIIKGVYVVENGVERMIEGRRNGQLDIPYPYPN